jgi:LPXTG-site transpeptidase (sortase) family protein
MWQLQQCHIIGRRGENMLKSAVSLKSLLAASLVVAVMSLGAQQAPVSAAVMSARADVSQQQAATEFPVPDRILIDKLKVDAIIEPVGPSNKKVGKKAVEWAAPNNKNVGWHDYSGKLGEGKNIVLNGHNNIYGGVFRKLYTLEKGDQITLGADGKETVYEVEQVIKVLERGQPLNVRLKNAEYIQPMKDDRLTLVSCWPETSNSHRIIVIARPVK